MSLTLEKLRRLRDKEFDQLYDGNVDKWVAMVNNARTYAHSFIVDGETIRPGDLAEIIKNAIRNDPDFLTHVAENGTHQKYWVDWYADYILDRIYPTDAGE
jgi:hypothetical protein